MKSFMLFFVVFSLCLLVQNTTGLRVRGRWSVKQFFHFISRFGFQKTIEHANSDTLGYIYGNISSTQQPQNPIMLVVVDSEFFLGLYGNRTALPRDSACVNMFRKIDSKAWDPRCNLTGPEDFLRKVPCPNNKLCEDESVPDWVLPGYQFTFRISNAVQPR